MPEFTQSDRTFTNRMVNHYADQVIAKGTTRFGLVPQWVIEDRQGPRGPYQCRTLGIVEDGRVTWQANCNCRGAVRWYRVYDHEPFRLE